MTMPLIFFLVMQTSGIVGNVLTGLCTSLPLACTPANVQAETLGIDDAKMGELASEYVGLEQEVEIPGSIGLENLGNHQQASGRG